MRRTTPSSWRSFVWVLVPLALAGLYALVHPLLAPTPTLANVVPAEAILTHRYRNQAALDGAFFGAVDPAVRPSEEIAARRNLPRLPGVDPYGPFHLVFLPRAQRPDPSLMIFPVTDAKALRARFEDPSFFLDHGVQRHAQFLEIRGRFAAVGGDREAVRRLGTGGLTAEVLGEDHVLAIRVPGLIRYMLVSALEQPWRAVLSAWGFDPRAAAANEEGLFEVTGRVARVHDAWRTARMWSWLEEGRIRVDLEPAPGPLADVLARLGEGEGEGTGGTVALPDAPPTALLRIRTPNAESRVALAWTLLGVGVPLPAGLVEGAEDGAMPGPWGRVDAATAGGLLCWTAPSVGRPHLWTWAVAAPAGTLPALGAFHAAIPDDPGDAEAAEGELPWTRIAPGAGGDERPPSPPSPILRRRVRSTFDFVALGTSAEQAWRLFETHAALGKHASEPAKPAPGYRLVATFGLDATRARLLLGGMLERGGLLQALGGGDLTGAVWTDGRILRLEAHVERAP